MAFRSDRQVVPSISVQIFLVSALIIGTLFVFQFTPMSGMDEMYHYKRALQISHGHLLASHLGPNQWGGSLDTRAMRFEQWFDARRNAGMPTSRSEAGLAESQAESLPPGSEAHWFSSTASYPPLPYLPAAAGLWSARAMHLHLLAQLDAGRLASLGSYCALVAILVRLLPSASLAVLALMTTPTMLHLASCFSADPLTNALPMMFVALCLRYTGDERPRMTRAACVSLLALAMALGLLKLTCFVISLTVVVIPRECFRRPQEAWMFRLAVVGGSAFVAICWNATFPFVPGLLWHPGADPDLMLSFLLNQPDRLALMIGRSLVSGASWWWQDAFSRFGGGPSPYFFKVGRGFPGLGGWLIALLLLAGDSSLRSVRVAIMLLAIALLYALLVLLAFAVGFSAPTDLEVSGLQGRYFVLPLALALVGVGALLPRRAAPSWVKEGLLALYYCTVLSVSIIALGRYASLWG